MESILKFKDLELNEVHFDALKEICNIGMGHAATSLNMLIGSSIHLKIPEVIPAYLADIPEILGGTETIVVGIYLKITGDIDSSMLLIFPHDSAMAICSLLTGETPGENLELTELQRSAFMEIGNILSSSYLGAIERLLGKTFIPSVPGMAFDMLGSIVDYIIIQLGSEVDKTLLIKATFKDGDKNIYGDFYLLPDPLSTKFILEAADLLVENKNDE
jgi:chemotaxis protein CheC